LSHDPEVPTLEKSIENITLTASFKWSSIKQTKSAAKLCSQQKTVNPALEKVFIMA